MMYNTLGYQRKEIVGDCEQMDAEHWKREKNRVRASGRG